MHGLDCVFGVLMCQSCCSSKTCGLHLADVVVIWGGLGSCCFGMRLAHAVPWCDAMCYLHRWFG